MSPNTLYYGHAGWYYSHQHYNALFQPKSPLKSDPNALYQLGLNVASSQVLLVLNWAVAQMSLIAWSQTDMLKGLTPMLKCWPDYYHLRLNLHALPKWEPFVKWHKCLSLLESYDTVARHYTCPWTHALYQVNIIVTKSSNLRACWEYPNALYQPGLNVTSLWGAACLSWTEHTPLVNTYCILWPGIL